MDTHHRAIDHLASHPTEAREDHRTSVSGVDVRTTQKPLQELDELLSATVQQARNIC